MNEYSICGRSSLQQLVGRAGIGAVTLFVALSAAFSGLADAAVYVGFVTDPSDPGALQSLRTSLQPQYVEIRPGEVKTVYLAVWSTDGPLDIDAWSGSLYGSSLTDSTMTVMPPSLLPTGTAVNVGSHPRYDVGLGTIASGSAAFDAVTLMSVSVYAAQGFSESNLQLVGPEGDRLSMPEATLGGADIIVGSTRNIAFVNPDAYPSGYPPVGSWPTARSALGLPVGRFEVVAFVGTVVNVAPSVSTTLQSEPMSRVTLDVHNTVVGAPLTTREVVSHGTIDHERPERGDILPLSGGHFYLRPGDTVFVVAFRVPKWVRRVHGGGEDLPFTINFIRYLDDDPANTNQLVYRATHVTYSYPVTTALLRGPVDFDRLSVERIEESATLADIASESAVLYSSYPTDSGQ